MDDIEFYWGPSDFDRTHIFVGTWNWSLPFFRSGQGLAAALLGGWQISGITRYQTGAPVTVLGNTAVGNNRRADYTGADVYADERINPATGAVQWINPAAFTNAPENRRGTSERGQVRGPEYYVWDISVRKEFRLAGDVRMQIQADFFNAWNRVNWGNPNNSQTPNLSTAGFGTITTVTGQPRNIQLGARITF
jgi:hypothetical protein